MDNFIPKMTFDFNITQTVLQLIAHVDEFRGKWSYGTRKQNRYLKELRKIATIESIGSSTRIEGATLTDAEVKQLLDNIKITKLKNRDQQEVYGYYEVLELIFEHHKDIQLTESYLMQLHHMLLKYSSKDSRHRGHYKSLPNKVIATYPTGEQRVIFATTEPHLVESEMHELLNWTNSQLAQKPSTPCLSSGHSCTTS
jgi:Fic family protein